MLSASGDYREVLRSEFARRRDRNPSYSLRAFARDLQVTYSRLNEVINAKRGLSAAAAEKLARGLGLNELERKLFVARVDACHGRSAAGRKRAAEQVAQLTAARDHSALQLDVFELIAHWYHYAILELPALEDFNPDPQWVADRLGISKTEADAAIARLFRVGLLKKTRAGFAPVRDFTFSTSDIPSAGLKRHHEQMLKKATDAIHLQNIHERDLSAITVAIRKDELPKAKEMLKTFRRQFMRELERAKKRDAIYTLAIQFFRIDTNTRKK